MAQRGDRKHQQPAESGRRSRSAGSSGGARSRSNSTRGGRGGGGGSTHNASHTSGGWIRVVGSKKGRHRPSSGGSSSGSGGGANASRDPLAATAAYARQHHRRPVQPSAEGRAASGSGAFSPQIRKRLKTRARHRRSNNQHPAATTSTDSTSSSEFVTPSAERPSPSTISAHPAPTPGEPSPATRPATTIAGSPTSRAYSAARQLPVFSVQSTVRCTNGVYTSVRTLQDIVRASASAEGYALEADTPLAKPAAPVATTTTATTTSTGGGGLHTTGSSMPKLVLGETLHPSTEELEEGYSHMHMHRQGSSTNADSDSGDDDSGVHRSRGAAADDDDDDDDVDVDIDSDDDAPSPGHAPATRPSCGGGLSIGSTSLTFPPSAFTVEGIATPNTFYALPKHAPPPPIPQRHTYQDILKDYDNSNDSFSWHDDATDAARFADRMEALCDEVADLLRARPLLRSLTAPAFVLGDVHGNFSDLSFFLSNFLVMNDIALTPCQILCLGDYVDRGPHSLECVALLFALVTEAPDRVVLLRGNHEDRVVCGDYRVYGEDCFWSQCCARFGSERGTKVWRRVTRVFRDLPLACELSLPDSMAAPILCTHGGFPRFDAKDRSTFERIQLLKRDDFPRFLTLFPNNPLVQDDSGSESDLPEYVEAAWFTAFDLMWSDPTTAEDAANQQLDENGFSCNVRGMNVMSFSQRAVEEYLNQTGYAMLFRAHQEKQFGLRLSKSSKVLTLFSSSNYQGHGNGAGCAVVNGSGAVQLVMKNTAYNAPPAL